MPRPIGTRAARSLAAAIFAAVCIDAAPQVRMPHPREPASGQLPFGGGIRPDPSRRLAAGRLLVADRGVADPSFVETVVLLIDHGTDGAAGLVINRPSGVPVARLFEHLGLVPDARVPAYVGGPVEMASALALIRSADNVEGARRVVGDIHLVSSRPVMERWLTAGGGSDRVRVYLGYAGWVAGQLEREAAMGVWHVLDAEAETVFDNDAGSLWQRQISRTTLRQAMDSHSIFNRRLSTSDAGLSYRLRLIATAPM
jgi:putative transcriptional regulator